MHRGAAGEGGGADLGHRVMIGEIIDIGLGAAPMGFPFAEFMFVMEMRAVDVQHIDVGVVIIGVERLMWPQRHPADADTKCSPGSPPTKATRAGA